MKRLVIILLFIIFLLGGFLRFYNISNNPPGLYTDEVSIGLNAYDILKTGKDQFGYSYPLTFKSFGDYKMPGYIYLVSLSMRFFGETEFAVRFPSAVAGTLTILILFFIIRELLQRDNKTKPHADWIALTGTAILAISPWHLQFSRGGFEVCVALLLYSISLLLGIIYSRKKNWSYLLTAIIFLVFAEYTYQSYRVISPLTIFIFTIIMFLSDKKMFKKLAVSLIVFVALTMPLFLFSLTAQGQERLISTSAFGQNSGLIGLLKDAIVYLNNYFSYFSLTFLFHLGDQINRHQVQNFGLLYFWQLPFCILGIYFLTKTKNNVLRFAIIFLFLIAPVASAIALPSPHTLRFLGGVIPFTLLTTLGIYQVYIQKNKFTKPIFFVTGIFIFILLIYFLDYYFIQYPKESQIDWGGGCKSVVTQLQIDYRKYDYIIVDRNLVCVPEYYAFYAPSLSVKFTDPSWIKPQAWKDKGVLYVRPYYGNNNPEHLYKNIYIENINHDVFAQFYSL